MAHTARSQIMTTRPITSGSSLLVARFVQTFALGPQTVFGGAGFDVIQWPAAGKLKDTIGFDADDHAAGNLYFGEGYDGDYLFVAFCRLDQDTGDPLLTDEGTMLLEIFAGGALGESIDVDEGQTIKITNAFSPRASVSGEHRVREGGVIQIGLHVQDCDFNVSVHASLSIIKVRSIPPL